MSEPSVDSSGQIVQPRDITHVGGTAQTGRDITPDLAVLTDLKKGASNADGLASQTSNVMEAIAKLFGYDPTGGHEHWDRVQIKDLAADGLGSGQLGLIVQAAARLFNGANFDRQRNNEEITVLASAARTATTNSADQVNYNGRGVWVALNVISVPGTDTVQFKIQGKESLQGNYEDLLSSPAYATTGTRFLRLYPGLTAVVNATANDILPRTWRVAVTHSAATSFTYSVFACVIL